MGAIADGSARPPTISNRGRNQRPRASSVRPDASLNCESDDPNVRLAVLDRT